MFRIYVHGGNGSSTNKTCTKASPQTRNRHQARGRHKTGYGGASHEEQRRQPQLCHRHS